MVHSGSVYIALFVFAFGLAYKASTWFRYSVGSEVARVSPGRRLAAAVRGIAGTLFSTRIWVLLKVLIVDVVLQLRIAREDFLRWAAHMCLFGAFLALFLMHALGRFTTAALFPDYYSTLNPYLFLRNVLGALVILGVGLAVVRRFVRRKARPRSNAADVYALGIIGVILVSGFLLEAVKISSLSAFDEMVESYMVQPEPDELKALESFWVREMGLVSQRAQGPFDAPTLEQGRSAHELQCMQCHSPPQWAFASYGLSRVLSPFATVLGDASARALLWNLHFFACLVGLAYLPFSKMLHIITSPLSLLVNAVMDPLRSDPVNIATRQMLELDACTHCGACSARCSVAPILEEFPNPIILPSEKIAAIKSLAAGKAMDASQTRAIQQGLHLCTNCGRCTEACPAGINLAALWVSVREALLEKAVPELLLLSPLSLRRGLARDCLDENRYARPLEIAREAVLPEGHLTGLEDKTLFLTPDANPWLARLNGSFSSTGFTKCYRCVTCSNSCPVVRNYANPAEALGMLPHQIMHALGLKLHDRVLGSRMLWNCLGCYQCQQNCPQGVRVSDVMYELKNLAIARAYEKLSHDAKDRQ